MRNTTRLPAWLATRASRRAFLQWSVVIGAAFLVIGSVLAWRCQDDAAYPAVGALRLTDGTVAWSVRSPEQANRTVIGASEDVVLIEEGVYTEERTSTSRRTIALAAADGSERWRRATGDMPTPPGPFDGQGIVVLADQDAGALVGVDVLTGEERWRVASREAPLANSLTVAVVWDVASQVSPLGFRGMDRVTGDELWVSDMLLADQPGYLGARTPAAVLGEVLVVPTGATVTAIDLRTGAMLWQGPQFDHLAAADGIVVGIRGANGGPAPSITAIDAASGQERWTAPGRESYGGLLAVGDGVIVVIDPDDGGLVAYELASGGERWRAAQSPTTYVDPQLISGTSLIGLWEVLAVVSTTDGATLWATTDPFGSSLSCAVCGMSSVGSNSEALFVAINSLPSMD
jgi:outer membrane protein assembly factor BamB